MFVHTSTSMTYAIASNGSLLQLPLVGTFDVLMARGLLELLTDTLVAVILLAGFGALGLGALPQDFAGVSVSLLVVWLLGCGCGFVNAVINAFAKSWDKIWAQLTRLLYFCSGIFRYYVASATIEPMRRARPDPTVPKRQSPFGCRYGRSFVLPGRGQCTAQQARGP